MRVLVATSWGGACGIANYAEMAIEAVQRADPGISCEARADWLDPAMVPKGDEVLWLNYHRALHSRWTVEEVGRLRFDRPVVITFHDTIGERAPDALSQGLHDIADAFIVHEPCEGLKKQILIRQGVPAEQLPYHLDRSLGGWGSAPVLGTVGFNFPWKNYDRLAQYTDAYGWGLMILSANATPEDIVRWEKDHPRVLVISGYLPTAHLVSRLTGCDATIFAYECANTGTSAAIRLGLAARKPVVAWSTRMFRDLQLAEETHGPGVTWCDGFEDLPTVLARVPIQRVDPGVVAIAERDSWRKQGEKYAAIFRRVMLER